MTDAVRVVAEISLAWFKAHPDAGAEYMAKFHEQHPATEWVVVVQMERTGFFDIIATRKTGTVVAFVEPKS